MERALVRRKHKPARTQPASQCVCVCVCVCVCRLAASIVCMRTPGWCTREYLSDQAGAHANIYLEQSRLRETRRIFATLLHVARVQSCRIHDLRKLRSHSLARFSEAVIASNWMVVSTRAVHLAHTRTINTVTTSLTATPDVAGGPIDVTVAGMNLHPCSAQT